MIPFVTRFGSYLLTDRNDYNHNLDSQNVTFVTVLSVKNKVASHVSKHVGLLTVVNEGH